jgi:hypothetical protein
MTGVFTFLFVLPRPESSIPAGRYAITVLAMFSTFCYALELERFGRALLGPAESN